MRTLRTAWKRVIDRAASRTADAEFSDELAANLDLHIEDNIRAGMSPEAARRHARLTLGGLVQTIERQRDARSYVWLSDLRRDVGYAWRMLARSPGFTVVSILSLSLGVGANCAMFSGADAMLLRPLPVPNPSGVVTVGSTRSLEESAGLVASYRDYLDLRERTQSFDGLLAFTHQSLGLATEPGAVPTLKMGLLVSGNFFTVLGVPPEFGRAFRPEEDDVPGRDAVVVLGHTLWRQQFGADRSVLGRQVRINGIDFTVIGVAPASFTGMNPFVQPDFYAPLLMWPRLTGAEGHPLEARDVRELTVKGRLRAGITIAGAQSELTVLGADLERAYPETNRHRRMAIRSELQERIAQDPSDAMLVALLMALAVGVLLVACANVAGLLTSRARSRAREIAVRLAMGAGRWRVIRQLMTESLLLALGGGVFGLAFGYAGMRVFSLVQLPTDLPIGLFYQLDARVLVYSIIVASLSVAFFGVVPALKATRGDLAVVIKANSAAAPARTRPWGQGALVVGQVGLSVVLLAVAAFMIRDFRQQVAQGPGFRTDHVLMLSLDPSLVRYTEPETRRFYDRVIERIRSAPGVQSATLASSIPLSNDDSPGFATVVPEGYQFPAGRDRANVLETTVDDQYFDTLAIPLVKGRAFRADDSATAPRVAIVNDQLAQHYWPGQDAIGKRFRLDDSHGAWVEIVGVAKTAKYLSLTEPPTDFVYLSERQQARHTRMNMFVHAGADPLGLVMPLREIVRSVDANQPIFNVRTMEDFYRMRALVFTVMLNTMSALGVVGLSLAIVGLYGLVAYAASRRTREIGIRMAIGAARADILRMVLKQGVVLALAGLSIGVVAGIGAQRWLQSASLVYGGLDVAGLGAVAAVVLMVTTIASYLPARRAARVDPIVALRCE